MSVPDATVTTTTTVDGSPPEPEDGIVREPGTFVANILWILLNLTLCLGVLALLASLVLLAFTPKEPAGSVDAATLAALLGTLVAALMSLYRRGAR